MWRLVAPGGFRRNSGLPKSGLLAQSLRGSARGRRDLGNDVGTSRRMTATRRPLAWAGIFLTASVIGAGVAHACSCLDPGSAAQQLSKADVMIVAQVSSTRRLPPVEGYAMAETRFAVSETIKGPVRRSWTIRHQRGDSALCGVNFRPGQAYAFLARFEDGKVWTGSCDRAFYPLPAYRAAAAAEAARDPERGAGA